MSTSLGNVASYSSCLVADGDCGYQKLCEGFEIAFFSAPPSFQNCSVGTMVTRKEVAYSSCNRGFEKYIHINTCINFKRCFARE